MIYNELSWAVDNEIIGYDDLFIVENIEPQEQVADDKKVGDTFEIKDEKTFNL